MASILTIIVICGLNGRSARTCPGEAVVLAGNRLGSNQRHQSAKGEDRGDHCVNMTCLVVCLVVCSLL